MPRKKVTTKRNRPSYKARVAALEQENEALRARIREWERQWNQRSKQNSEDAAEVGHLFETIKRAVTRLEQIGY